MIMAKRFISVLFLLVLMLPMGIGLAHSFHDHDNRICYVKTEQHIHQEKTDCDQLHHFSQTLNQEIAPDVSLIKVYWSTLDQLVYSSRISFDLDKNDPDRGPPFFNVF